MNITIINDCRDANAIGRQISRTAALLDSPVSFIGVANDVEAAGNLIDVIDALHNFPGVILVNVAPRNGKAKKWPNGTPFGYFRYKDILVLASIDGLTLSLVKKYGLTDAITVLDLPDTLDQLISAGSLDGEMKDPITRTQFRSYDFLPRVAAFLVQGRDLEGSKLDINDVHDMPPAVWWTDNFGNCKTTLWQEELKKEDFKLDEHIKVLTHYARLKDVPDKDAALVVGSSGLGARRFIEIVVQGGSAQQRFGLTTGDSISAEAIVKTVIEESV